MTALARQRPPELLVPQFEPEFFLWLDFETFYDADYTLRKLSTSDYIRDSRFQTIGVGVQDEDGESAWMEEAEFVEWAQTVPWDKVALGSHNAPFDHFILSHHYDIYPAFSICTMSMARTFGIDGGVSLEVLGNHFGVGQKGHEVLEAKGKRREDFTQDEWLRYGDYCQMDVTLCKGIFDKMTAIGFPEPELWLVDATVKMFTRPVLMLDEPKLRQYQIDETKRKQALLERIGMDKKAIGSNATLARAFLELGVDAPMKVSPATGKPIYAFAKKDPGMMDLLEHSSDEVRWLAEARISVKSTIEMTRTQRMLKLGENGQPLPVGLNYWKAHTGRWSGTNKTNFQNLGRVNPKVPSSGMLKKSIIAPPGYHVVAADSGAIEARGTGWLAGHGSLVESFRQGKDIYSEQASIIYNRVVDRKRKGNHPEFNPDDEAAGGVGKVACFAADTRVLTDRGWVRIPDVLNDDKLWDGVEWVTHQGVVDQGEQEVLRSLSVAATPGHEFLTSLGWRQWSEVLTNPSLIRSALLVAHLPSSNGPTRCRMENPSVGIQSSGVLAGGKVKYTGQTSGLENLHGVTRVQKSPRIKKGFGFIATLCRMMNTAVGFSTVGRLVSLGAITRKMLSFTITVGEVLEYVKSGVRTLRRFSVMLSRFQGGTNLSLSSIGLITTADMSQEMSGSYPGQIIYATSARSQSCNARLSILKQTTRVYDILSVGSRNRFMIICSEGPMLVHNCLGLGYQMWWPTFAKALLAGPMGAPPIQFIEKDVEAMGADVDEFANDERAMKQFKKIVSRLDERALLIHCAAANHVVRTYRNNNKPIVDLWRTMDQVIETMEQAGPDEEFTFGPNECLIVVRHGIILPNGLMLRYPGLRKSDDTVDEEGNKVRGGYSYLGQYGKLRVHMYGGKLTENVIQAISRIVIGEQMLSIKAKYGYETCLCTHDEIASVVPESEAELATHRLVGEMKISPKWAAGWPLTAEGGHAQSYGEC